MKHYIRNTVKGVLNVNVMEFTRYMKVIKKDTKTFTVQTTSLPHQLVEHFGGKNLPSVVGVASSRDGALKNASGADVPKEI